MLLQRAKYIYRCDILYQELYHVVSARHALSLIASQYPLICTSYFAVLCACFSRSIRD